MPSDSRSLAWQAANVRPKAGTVIYRLVWEDYPPDLIWYEPEENIEDTLLEEYKARLSEDESQEAASAQEDAELDDLEEEEDMPPP